MLAVWVSVSCEGGNFFNLVSDPVGGSLGRLVAVGDVAQEVVEGLGGEAELVAQGDNGVFGDGVGGHGVNCF